MCARKGTRYGASFASASTASISVFSGRPTCIGRIRGHETEQRETSRKRTGVFAVRDDVVRQARRRCDVRLVARLWCHVAVRLTIGYGHARRRGRSRRATSVLGTLPGFDHRGGRYVFAISGRGAFLVTEPENRNGGNTGRDTRARDGTRKTHPAFAGGRRRLVRRRHDRSCAR